PPSGRSARRAQPDRAGGPDFQIGVDGVFKDSERLRARGASSSRTLIAKSRRFSPPNLICDFSAYSAAFPPSREAVRPADVFTHDIHFVRDKRHSAFVMGAGETPTPVRGLETGCTLKAPGPVAPRARVTAARISARPK